MRHRREWKKNQIVRSKFNDEVYELIEQAISNYRTEPPHVRYNDARLVPREILDNVYQYNKSVFIIGLEIEIETNHVVKMRIYHDGDMYDPFAEESDCTLLKQLNYEYKFNSRFIGTDSGRHRLDIAFDLSALVGGKNV
jgi:hypothetical protein